VPPSPVPPAPVVPIFATPFAVLQLPEAEKLNAIVAGLMNERAASFGASHGASPDAPAPPLCYRSPEDLLEWQDPSVQKVVGEVARGLWSVVASVSDFSDEILKSLSLQARAAFTIVHPDGSVPAHSYPLTSWCGVYCVEAPPPSTTRADSGMLRLYESRLATMFSDPSNNRMRIPYTAGHYSWRPVPGEAAFFPASVTHEVAMVRAPGRLILLTLRGRFIGPGQEAVPRW